MKIEIKGNGEIFLDNNPLEFTADKLEEILNNGLVKELEIEDNSLDEHKEIPYVQLIKGIQEALQDNSDFMKQLNEFERIKKEEQKKLDDIENN